jgi:phasin family protein
MTQPQAEFLDLYRAGLKTTADLMKASLQNAERLQNQQLSAIRSALDQQSRAVNDLSQARSLDELLSLQTRLAGSQFERAVGFWSELYQTQMQQAQSWINEINGAAQSATSSTAAAIRQASPKQQENQHQQQQHRKSA